LATGTGWWRPGSLLGRVCAPAVGRRGWPLLPPIAARGPCAAAPPRLPGSAGAWPPAGPRASLAGRAAAPWTRRLSLRWRAPRNQIKQSQSINPSPPPTSPPPSTMPAPVRPTSQNPTSSSTSFAPPPAPLRLPHAVCRAPLLPPAARRRWEEGARQRGRWRRDECAGGRREEQDGGDKVGDPLTTST
jgi:hypothetical protein